MSTTGSREKALPEKVWLDDGYLRQYAQLKSGFPSERDNGVCYVPESALAQARAEARASAFEEALRAVEAYRLETTPYRDSLSAHQVLIWLRNRAARSSAGAEEGDQNA